MKVKTLALLLGLSIPFLGFSQDKIYLNNGSTLECKVVKLKLRYIEYKLKDSEDLPLYTIKKSNVNRIEYADGRIDDLSHFAVKESHRSYLGLMVGYSAAIYDGSSIYDIANTQSRLKIEFDGGSSFIGGLSGDLALNKKGWLSFFYGLQFFQTGFDYESSVTLGGTTVGDPETGSGSLSYFTIPVGLRIYKLDLIPTINTSLYGDIGVNNNTLISSDVPLPSSAESFYAALNLGIGTRSYISDGHLAIFTKIGYNIPFSNAIEPNTQIFDLNFNLGLLIGL